LSQAWRGGIENGKGQEMERREKAERGKREEGRLGQDGRGFIFCLVVLLILATVIDPKMEAVESRTLHHMR